MKPAEIYTQVTNTVIELLESHKEGWQKPWISLGQDGDYARNPFTSRYYNGINQFLLSYKLMQKQYRKHIWMTFKQIQNMGGHVEKGQKSTPVIFYKTGFIDRNKKYYKPETYEKLSSAQIAQKGIEAIPILKLYRVFNVAQTADLPDTYYEIDPPAELTPFEKDEAAENLIKATGADIEIKLSNRAYFNVNEDKIIIPLREQFNGQTEPFYGVVLHELGHWSGHKKRLNRPELYDSSKNAYAREELVAELIAAFSCARLGFTKTITNNAAYLNSWLSVLREDHKAIIKAASEAQKGADFIFNEASHNAPAPPDP